jgi:hypothetical protein
MKISPNPEPQESDTLLNQTFLSFSFFFCWGRKATGSIKVWTQGFILAQHAFYHLSHAPTPFCFSYFSDRVLLFAWPCPRIVILLPMPSWNYSVWQHSQLVCWDGVSLSSLPPRLSSHHDPPNLNLLSIWDSRCAPSLSGCQHFK